MLVALKNLRTEIDGDVKDALDSLAEQRGMTIRAITERAFRWLLDQDSQLQAIILEQIPKDPDYLRLVFAKLEQGRAATSSHPASTAEQPAERPGPPGGAIRVADATPDRARHPVQPVDRQAKATPRRR